MVTTQLICDFDFAYAKNRFSHAAAHIVTCVIRTSDLLSVKERDLKFNLINFFLIGSKSKKSDVRWLLNSIYT